MTLVSSNRLEILCDKLAELMGDTSADPLAAEVVVVQSRGMERWLRLELARPERLGVCANVRFPFPNRFLADVVDALFPERFDGRPFDRDVLCWRILRNIPELTGEPWFAPISAYLAKGDPGDDARRYDLAWAVADRFDQYVLYRPDVVLGWESGEPGDWQAELWRAICRDVGGRSPEGSPAPRSPIHRAALQRKLLQDMELREDLAGLLPFARVCVFGVSVLPPFHLSVLNALSRHIEVHMFLLNPSEEYWSLVMSERGKARVMRRQAEERPGRAPAGAAEQAMESGNALLASLGRLGKAFFDHVIECEPEDRPAFVEPGTDSMLHVIQSDILHMVERRRSAEGQPEDGRYAVRDDDGSLTVHSCHSATREAEVLHDYLLDLFQSRPELLPGDVLVMSPDVEAYAPVLQAVLESGEEDRERIPLSVSDRPLLAQSSLARTVFRILELPESRCAATEILGLVLDPRVRKRFDMAPGDVEVIAGWVREAGIRWGLDERHRAELGLPAERQNTWEAGLDRLLLGTAMSGRAGFVAEAAGSPPSNSPLYRGILPTEGPEGSGASVLGGVADLLEAVKAARVRLSGRHQTPEWPQVVREALGGLLGPDFGDEEESEELDAILCALASDIHASGKGPSGLLGVGAIRAALERRFGDERATGRFLTGRVTVCKMQPMRSIPAEVICLVGMSDGSFPARERSQGFDLMARSPRKGDRSRVDEDRYLFLETLLSARSALYVSYVGQSIRDNTSIAPAVPVSLLLDYADQAFRWSREENARTRLEVKHPLQPWSPRYFAAPSAGRVRELYSYSRRNALAARALGSSGRERRRFCPVGLRPPEQPDRTVALDDLVRFLSNPCRHFVNRRLGFFLGEGAGPLEDREPFVLAGLERHAVAQEMLGALLRGAEAAGAIESASRVLRSEGRIPHGAAGDLALGSIEAEVRELWERIQDRRVGEERLATPISVSLDGTVVEATLPPIYGSCVLDFRWGRLRAVDRIRAWLTHLAVAVSGALEGPWTSVFVATDRTLETSLAPDPRERLAEILRFYREGWCRPLPFFPETSLAYSDASLDGDLAVALTKARAKWEPNPWGRPESEDLYFSLCFGDEDPLGDEFRGISHVVLDPCLAAQRKLGKGA